MQFSYQFPIVYADRKPVGTLAEALNAMPDFTDQIMVAHGVAWGNAASPIADLRQQLADRDAKITALKTQLAPAIAEITDELMDAGLLSWGNAASTAAGNISEALGNQVMGLIMQLKTTAIEPPSWDQCDRIKQIFGTIGHLSGVWPTPGQAQAMQAILDQGAASTGPVGADKLSFHPWMGAHE